MEKKVVIIIPAYNEEKTIYDVVTAFARQDKDFEICVVDNNSNDQTRSRAFDALTDCGNPGQVLVEKVQGKGAAIRRAFSFVDADIYVMVDADMTYPAEAVHQLIEPVRNKVVDMVVGDRLTQGHYGRENKRAFHEGGNHFVKWIIARLYHQPLHDILSGYRVFSRRFVKTYPVLCSGFELEADLTLHALDKRLSWLEIPIEYKDRPEGSESKLNTIQDGMRILKLIFNIFRYYKPFCFFGAIALLFFVGSLAAGSVPVYDYVCHQFVYHVPLAILASAMAILSILFLGIALLLDSIATNHRFNFEVHLLSCSNENCNEHP